ncbi:MAG: VWA domain-containing protein [Acidobacteria bacterium]|nr:MAG: VWA domain-containing protein [Acidobacteriota bacterium]REK01568.1 MAG: VWA domain-containing protein [Acidobacteriota bacterium]REK14524.1 MAG: VWA domain-containing protein [Acidobacteriota bacterium]REK45239.1 MAG: VWA domain-containing protein [Acidobacteriota bacterium]
MSLRSVFLAACTAPLLLLFVPEAPAQGIIIPRPCDVVRRCPIPVPPVRLPVNLPVKSIEIDTKIEGQVASTTVTQVFENKTPYTLEGVYFFPLPADASVSGFSIWENGKKLTGEVRSKDEARKIYDEIVRSMKDPGLLEYAGKGLLQASIFPILPNSEKKLELKYSQVLKADSGTVAYSYPLGTGKAVWNRQLAEGVSRPVPQIGAVSGRIEVAARLPIRNIYSPSHSIDVNKRGDNRAVISFESSGDPTDVKLFYGLSEEEFGLSLITYREASKDGYYLLMISPNDGRQNAEVVAKDVVFVLDTSGSMQDDGKIEKARPALNFGIKSLNRGDRFNVINFSGEEHLMEVGLVDATDDNKALGVEFVNRLKPNGGTNINDALLAALDQFDSRERPRMVVLLTDGLPTVGEKDAAKIVANVREKGVEGLRLFPFGVGYDVNTRLLDSLGSENSGIADYVEPKEDLEIKVSNFFTKVNSPVLSDISIDYGAVVVEKQYPRKLADIFRGAQSVIIGRYTNQGDLNAVILRLRGLFGGSERTFDFGSLDFPMRALDNDFLPRLWATRRVGWLIEQIRVNGESKELKDEIVDLGTRYGIVTPYTSYLAVDGTFRMRETVGNRFQIDGAASADISAAIDQESGRSAVKQSVQQNSLQMNSTVAPSAGGSIFLRQSSANQFVANKNFIRDRSVWIDAEYDSDLKLPETNLKFGSEGYFDFALNNPDAAQYLAISKNVTFVLNGRVYNVRE